MKNIRAFKVNIILISIFILNLGAGLLCVFASSTAASVSQAAQTPYGAANQIIQLVVRDHAAKDVVRLAIDRALENIQDNTHDRKLFLRYLVQGIKNTIDDPNLAFQVARERYGLTPAEFVEGMKGSQKNQHLEVPQELGA